MKLEPRGRARSAVVSIFAAASLAPMLLAPGCQSPIKTSYDLDPEADFSRYQTFAWVSQEPLIKSAQGQTTNAYISPLEDKRIRRAVNREMVARGYQEVDDPSHADLVVSFTVGREEKTRVYDSPSSGSLYYGGYGYGYGGWYGGSQVRVQQYTEGTLAIEFFDRQTRQAVWVGIATKRLTQGDDSAEIIQRAVTGILEEFPRRS